MVNPTFPFEIVSRPLEVSEVLPLLPKVAELSRLLGAAQLEVMWGWDCSDDVQWKAELVDPGGLEKFVRDGQTRGVYDPGHSDVFVGDSEERFEFLFCHELDLHFRCMERALFEQVIDAWNEAGLDAHVVRED